MIKILPFRSHESDFGGFVLCIIQHGKRGSPHKGKKSTYPDTHKSLSLKGGK